RGVAPRPARGREGAALGGAAHRGDVLVGAAFLVPRRGDRHRRGLGIGRARLGPPPRGPPHWWISPSPARVGGRGPERGPFPSPEDRMPKVLAQSPFRSMSGGRDGAERARGPDEAR